MFWGIFCSLVTIIASDNVVRYVWRTLYTVYIEIPSAFFIHRYKYTCTWIIVIMVRFVSNGSMVWDTDPGTLTSGLVETKFVTVHSGPAPFTFAVPSNILLVWKCPKSTRNRFEWTFLAPETNRTIFAVSLSLLILKYTVYSILVFCNFEKGDSNPTTVLRTFYLVWASRTFSFLWSAATKVADRTRDVCLTQTLRPRRTYKTIWARYRIDQSRFWTVKTSRTNFTSEDACCAHWW